MTEKIYYIESRYLDTLEVITYCFPCFFEWEPVEMDYLKVTYIVRDEDLPTLEKALRALV